MPRFDPADTLMKVCEVLGCQATAIEPVERVKLLMNELTRLRNENLDFRRRLGDNDGPTTGFDPS
jgi:hypothetical protein